MDELDEKSDARAQRFASRQVQLPNEPTEQSSSASLLVTFLWRDREKLPALAGRIPAAVHRVERLIAKAY
jgi:hypothetical protein